MATKGKQATKTQVADLTKLNQPPDTDVMMRLRVRNISRNALAMPSHDRTADLSLGVKGEMVIEPAWAKNRHLRKLFEHGALEVEWVDKDFTARAIPDPDDAPDDARLESNFDKAYAKEIVLSDDETAMRLVNVDVKSRETGGPDIKFFKDRFWKLLKLTEWMEKQLDARKNVLRAIDRRLQEIRAM